MENKPFPIPTGEAFLVSTPYLDKISEDLRKSELLRQKQYADAGKELDDEYSKNVSSIRDADIPTATKKFNDYKLKWKQYNKKGHTITPQEQLDLLTAKADMLNHISKSKSDKENNEDLPAKDLIRNPNNFVPEAHQILIERRKLPLEKLSGSLSIRAGASVPYDLTNTYDNILYKGGNTDFTKQFKEAEGKEKEWGAPTIVDNGLTTTTTKYKGVNPPAIQYQKLAESQKGSNWEKDFLIKHDYTDDEANEIVKGYEVLKNTPEFKNAYKDIPDIPASAFASKLGKAMALTVMKNAINNPPKIDVGKPVPKLEAITDRKEKWQETMLSKRFANQLYLEGVKNNNILARGKANPDFVGSTGNSLDEIGGVRDVANQNGKRISKGIAYNPDGSAMTGELVIAAEDLPSNVTTSLAAGKLPRQRYYKLFARNGVIESITTMNGEVTRVGMENLQKQADTEPAKKPAKVFGGSKPTTKPASKASKWDKYKKN